MKGPPYGYDGLRGASLNWDAVKVVENGVKELWIPTISGY